MVRSRSRIASSSPTRLATWLAVTHTTSVRAAGLVCGMGSRCDAIRFLHAGWERINPTAWRASSYTGRPQLAYIAPMKTLRFLLRSAGALSFLLAPLGLLAAACSGALMATIHRALSTHVLDRTLLLAFFGFGAGRIVTSYLSTELLGDHAARAGSAVRREIITRLLSVPHRQIERVGPPHVLS